MAVHTTTHGTGYEPGMAVTAEEYERLSLTDPSITWELHRGRLREKPGMAWEHNDLTFELGHLLRLQLDRRAFRVRVNAARVRWSAKNYYIPDVAVVPLELGRDLRGRPDRLEAYSAPLPLVVEVWSRSTGDYDVAEKLLEYQRRGDQEIWRIHPYDRTLTAWRRRDDGSYTETLYTSGTVQPIALPGVTIDLDELFDA